MNNKGLLLGIIFFVVFTLLKKIGIINWVGSPLYIIDTAIQFVGLYCVIVLVYRLIRKKNK